MEEDVQTMLIYLAGEMGNYCAIQSYGIARMEEDERLVPRSILGIVLVREE